MGAFYTLYILLNAKNFFLCVCVCNIKLLCHFLPDLAQILNKAMNSKGAASKPVPGSDFTQLLILRHLFVSHTQILADSQSNCEKVVEPKRNPNRTDFSGIQLSIQLATKTGANKILLISEICEFVALSDRWRSEASHSAQKASY